MEHDWFLSAYTPSPEGKKPYERLGAPGCKSGKNGPRADPQLLWKAAKTADLTISSVRVLQTIKLAFQTR